MKSISLNWIEFLTYWESSKSKSSLNGWGWTPLAEVEFEGFNFAFEIFHYLLFILFIFLQTVLRFMGGYFPDYSHLNSAGMWITWLLESGTTVNMVSIMLELYIVPF